MGQLPKFNTENEELVLYMHDLQVGHQFTNVYFPHFFWIFSNYISYTFG